MPAAAPPPAAAAARGRPRGRRERAPRPAGGGSRAALAALAALALLRGWRAPAPGWLAGAPARRRAPAAARFGLGDEASDAEAAEEQAPAGARRPLGELKVGETLEGKVAGRSQKGVLIDVGCARNAYVFASRKAALDNLKPRQIVSATVERVEKDGALWVSVEGLPKAKRLTRELEAGEALEARVSFKSKSGVFLDVGCEREVVVARQYQVYERRLEIGQTVSAIVEKVGNTPVVSLEGLPKLKLLEDLVEGETVDGVVARKTGAGVIFDIGCESFGLLRRDKQRDVFKLEPNESVKGLRIDRIDINKSRIDLSLAGLSDLVAGRPEIERDVDKKDTPAAPTKAKPKKETAEPEKEAGAAKKKNNMNKEEATQGATQSVVLDGADLLPSMKGGSVTLELTGGLAIESVDMARGIITLTRDAAAAATKKKKKKQKKKKKVNASIAAAGEEKDEEDGPGGLLF